MKPMNFPNRVDKRRTEALERQRKYDGLSLQKKIDKQVANGHNGKQLKKLKEQTQ